MIAKRTGVGCFAPATVLYSQAKATQFKNMRYLRMTFRPALLLPLACCAFFASAQSIPVTLNINLTSQARVQRSVLTAHRSVTGLGAVAIRAELTYPRGSGGVHLGNNTGTITFAANRLDSFDVAVELPDGPGNPTGPRNFTGNVSGGTGAYKSPTGTVSFTLSNDNFGNSILSGNGSVTAGGKTTTFSLTPPLTLNGFPDGGDHNVLTGTGTVTPAGNATVRCALDSNSANGNDGVCTITFNATDSVSFYLSYDNADGPPPPNTPVVITGGTGIYATASGTGAVTWTQTATGFAVTGSGTITARAASVPRITQVSTAYGRDATAQNTFLVIKGVNLAPATTSKDGVIWSDAPEFKTGKMPTTLQGIGVKVNDIPGYVYFFCSAATHPGCASDQINVLSPLDNRTGDVRVVVTNNGVDSNPFIVTMTQVEPSFLIFNTLGYVAAVHANGTLIGPTTLYPGASTPAKIGETILVYAVGFGLPTTTLVQGSSTQFGPLPVSTAPRSPVCFLGTVEATVSAATLISPGLYQFNLIIPATAAHGDNLIYCVYSPPGFSRATPAGNLLTVE